MRIVEVSAEFAPIAKAGGMGEVVVGLSRELTRLGHEVDVILPKYDTIDLGKLEKVRLEVPDFKCLEKGSLYANAMWSATVEESHLHFLEARHPAGYFHRGKIYGCEDDTRRFIYFCRAVVEYLKLKGEAIDLLHLHDWHTALCAVLVRDLFHLPVKGIVLTLHNVEYQGKCATWDLDAVGMKGIDYLTDARMRDDDPKNPQTINLLKGGLVYSDAINAVSVSYAKEILRPGAGFCLDQTLRKVKGKLTGILNGIDESLWDPSKDPYLKAHFSASYSIFDISLAKGKLRGELGKQFGLDPSKRPWIGAITRLVSQKAPELLEEAVQITPNLGGTFLLLGSSPDPNIQLHFDRLRKENKKNSQVFLHFEYDEPLAHQIYGALDLLLVPSHFEPCGLTQLIAMRYGTVPIVRATGGLKDTVFEGKNGFLFEHSTALAMKEALKRAFCLFSDHRPAFETLIRRGIESDWSWRKPAQEYLKLFKTLI